MDKIIIDCKAIKSKDELHKLIKSKMNFPEYYGNNLDALHDCLTDITAETEIEVKNVEKFGAGFFGRLFKTEKYLQAQEYAGKFMLCLDETAEESDGKIKITYA